MLTYETLTEQALEALPLFRERYDREIAAETVDADDGKHIIFGLVFTPMLEELIRANKQPELRQTLDFLETMASSDDNLVVEVCDQSVLEAIYGEFPHEKIRKMLGKETQKGYDALQSFMW